MNFKIGDKVRIKNNLKQIEDFMGAYNPLLENYVGNICTIESFLFCEKAVKVVENGWTWDIRALELVDNITINDLQFADIVTLRNGERYVIADDALYGEERDYCCDANSISIWYHSDLTQNEDNKNQDIVKVERNGKVIYEREEPKVREMTVAEISKALGYEVKVVK